MRGILRFFSSATLVASLIVTIASAAGAFQPAYPYGQPAAQWMRWVIAAAALLSGLFWFAVLEVIARVDERLEALTNGE